MDNLELFAVVLGDSSPSKRMFGVEAPRTISVDEFKELVHAKRTMMFARFDTADLVLWKLNNPIQDTQVDEKVAAFSADQRLSAFAETMLPTRKLSYYFPSIPPEDSLHIIVQLPRSSRKREHSIDEDTDDRNAKRIKDLKSIPSVTPSSIKQKDVTRIFQDKVAYNRPNPMLATIPIALHHEAFAKFLDDYQHHEPTEQDNWWLTELRLGMVKEYPVGLGELERCREFRRIFHKHTSVRLHDASIPGRITRTDGHYIIGDDVVLLTEGKNEWAGLNSDPLAQAFAYYIESVKQRLDNGANEPFTMPCLIIYYVGSLIGFAGAITASKPQFELLTPPFDLATNEHDALVLKPLARALGALRTAIDSLKTYYTELQGPSPSRILPDPFFPCRDYYIGPDDSRVGFNYHERLDPDKLLFRGSSSIGGKTLLLKFTQKYSREAHAHCAFHKVAPELYTVEKLGGGWMMVVMEYLEKDAYTLLRDSNASKDLLRAGVGGAVSILHQGSFVHGDIRNVNVMVRNEWDSADNMNNVKLIDFDWAGPDATTRYPANVNHDEIKRPQGARDGKLITREHDDMMVAFLFE